MVKQPLRYFSEKALTAVPLSGNTLPSQPGIPTDPEGTDPNPELIDAIVHKPFYPDKDTPSIYLRIPFSAHVDIQLYNILGQNVGTVYNEMMMEGATEINIKERLHSHLTTGKYIYRIQIQNQKMSKSIMVA